MRRGVARIGLGLAVYVGGLVLTGLPAANASNANKLFACSNGTPGGVVLIPHDQVKAFEQQHPGFKCHG
jgi:hypothetical protein